MVKLTDCDVCAMMEDGSLSTPMSKPSPVGWPDLLPSVSRENLSLNESGTYHFSMKSPLKSILYIFCREAPMKPACVIQVHFTGRIFAIYHNGNHRGGWILNSCTKANATQTAPNGTGGK